MQSMSLDYDDSLGDLLQSKPPFFVDISGDGLVTSPVGINDSGPT